MTDRVRHRLADIIDAIDHIDSLLADKSFDDLESDRIAQAALERFIEIISEASRHVPDSMKNEEKGIPWQSIADIGNHLRHAYHRIDPEIIWRVHGDGHLARLREAAIRMSDSL